MKSKLILISGILIMSSLIFTNCEKDNFSIEGNDKIEKKLSSDVNSLVSEAKKIADANLVPEEIFKEFEKSLIFDENIRLNGAIYDGVEKYFDEKQSDAFWGVFGISLRNPSSMAPGGVVPHIFMGYKPKGAGNCKANPRWICTIWEQKALSQ